jgi:hypothetical protein
MHLVEQSVVNFLLAIFFLCEATFLSAFTRHVEWPKGKML